MTRYLSPLVAGPDGLRPDPIRSFVRRANAIERETGRKLVRLNIGQPDLPPARVLEAYRRGLTNPEFVNSSSYPPAEGVPELRSAIARMERDTFGVDADQSRVYVTLGGCGALKFVFKILGARVGRRNNILSMAPGWGVISNFAWEYEIEANFVNLLTPGGGFREEVAEENVDGDTVGIYVNSPNNPTGSILAPETVRDILEFARERDLWVVSDEAYQHLIHGGVEGHSSFAGYPEFSDRVFKCTSFSKILKPNIRLGALILPTDISDDLKSNFFTALRNEGAGVAAECQSGALEVLRSDPTLSYMDEVNTRYREKVAAAKGILKGAGCTFESYNDPKASFYLYPRVPFDDSRQLADRLLEAGVSVVPGTSFHLDGHVRIAIGGNMSLEDVETGTEMVASVIRKYA